MSGIHLPPVTIGRSAGWIINQASEKANIPQTSQGSSPDACISHRQLCKSFDTGKVNTSIAFIRRGRVSALPETRMCSSQTHRYKQQSYGLSTTKWTTSDWEGQYEGRGLRDTTIKK